MISLFCVILLENSSLKKMKNNIAMKLPFFFTQVLATDCGDLV